MIGLVDFILLASFVVNAWVAGRSMDMREYGGALTSFLMAVAALVVIVVRYVVPR